MSKHTKGLFELEAILRYDVELDRTQTVLTLADHRRLDGRRSTLPIRTEQFVVASCKGLSWDRGLSNLLRALTKLAAGESSEVTPQRLALGERSALSKLRRWCDEPVPLSTRKAKNTSKSTSVVTSLASEVLPPIAQRLASDWASVQWDSPQLRQLVFGTLIEREQVTRETGRTPVVLAHCSRLTGWFELSQMLCDLAHLSDLGLDDFEANSTQVDEWYEQPTSQQLKRLQPAEKDWLSRLIPPEDPEEYEQWEYHDAPWSDESTLQRGHALGWTRTKQTSIQVDAIEVSLSSKPKHKNRQKG